MACIHIVRPGDCLSSLADAYGLSSWHVIYDAPENADFRSKRDNPNLVYPGDEIYIPDPAPRAVKVPMTGGISFEWSFLPHGSTFECRMPRTSRWRMPRSKWK
jgi:hypothetical protein